MPAIKRPIATPDPKVKSVLEKYLRTDIKEGTHDASKFHIYLMFEDTKQTLWVPNPRTLPRRSCVIWPYEIKDCLGITGTVSDVWMKVSVSESRCDELGRCVLVSYSSLRSSQPVALNPTGVPTELSDPLYFGPSERHGSMPVIDTSLLRQGVTYHVQFDDKRMDCLEDLSDEQKREIQETFERYDADGNGNISRDEALLACRNRTEEGKAAIDKQVRTGYEQQVTRIPSHF